MLRLNRERMLSRLTLLLAALAVLSPGQSGPERAPSEPIKVGVMPTPPFVIKDSAGKLSGISVELWELIAADLGVEYELEERPYDVQGLLSAVAEGEVDVGVAAFTITAAREEKVDFSHSYFETGLGIAAQRAGSGDVLATLWSFLRQFSGPLLTLVGVLLAVGALIWGLERRSNPDQFHHSAARGLADGLWWSAVTMTTVGYGDKSPQTFLGRLVGLVWMFASLFLISFFTALLASSFTAVQLTPRIQSPEELSRARVGVVANASGQQELDRRGIRAFAYPDLAQACQALLRGELDAVVHDAAILQYLIQENRWTTLVVLPETLDAQSYGLALPSGSPLREPVDRALLRAIHSDAWRETLLRYLGDSSR
ncbi:MAG: transporter substrate-binding domain-containing protein [Acidobacteria bacterium]|nr:transporter substrate-binding domain-containing protein [Acidobacteriota bacterium]